MIKRILVAIDGSDPAWRALDVGCELAKRLGAELLLFHAVADAALPDELARYSETENLKGPTDFLLYSMIVDGLAEDTKKWAERRGVENAVWRAQKGDPADTIVNSARLEEADLICMGHGPAGSEPC